ncbi:MAG: anti-sigma factor [Gordonia sp. (in: high G+C Gram-positive bacteria)]|uniref:anti-sigma factor n=1 Tax=Gordonia sp. (in: high G+C Gram-positive bacteria) TaxID=84139 RepID=UPI0039E7027D
MSDDELIEWATLVGLDAIDADERAELDARLAAGSPDERAVYERALRGTREAMARTSATTATPPPQHLRATILASVAAGAAPVPEGDRTRLSRRLAYLAAAAVIAIATGTVGWLLGAKSGEVRESPAAERVFAAGDARSVSGAVATGRATLTVSDRADTAVLVMNDVPPPRPGTVYQMWLEGPGGAMTSAGTMGPADVAPSTTAVIPGIRTASRLAFTVEPPGGSAQPTSAVVAQLPLR